MARGEDRQRRQRFADPFRCWAVIRRLRTVRIADLVEAGVPDRNAKAFIHRLLQNGILVSDARAGRNRGKFGPAVYTLIKDVGRRCPRFDAQGGLNPKPSAQERMWAAMKPLRQGFVPDELAALARVSSRNTLMSYIVALHSAGYVEIVQSIPHRFSSRYPTYRYRLVRAMNTGPEPPILLRDGSVWDANLDKIVWTPGDAKTGSELAAEEVAA